MHLVLADLASRVAEQESEQLQSWLPVLEEVENNVEDTLKRVQLCETAASHYIQQPAQLCLPWLAYQQHNLNEWLDTVRSLCVQLKQLQQKNAAK